MTILLNDLCFCKLTSPPSPLQMERGGGRLRGVAVVQDQVLVHGGFGFCRLGERGWVRPHPDDGD